jgi:hypothetical protein
MKITYEIDTKDPDQQMERRQLEKANDMARVLWEMTLNVRGVVNRQIEAKVEQGYRVSAEDAISMVYKVFNDLIEAYGIRIEELSH